MLIALFEQRIEGLAYTLCVCVCVRIPGNVQSTLLLTSTLSDVIPGINCSRNRHCGSTGILRSVFNLYVFYLIRP